MSQQTTPNASPTQQPHHRIEIADASAWVLRLGVAASALVMVVGVLVSFFHQVKSVQQMEHSRFDYHPGQLLHEIMRGNGKAMVEAGVYLLIFTPIMRVATSTVLFAVEERDWVYVLITLGVLVLTVGGLIWFG